MQLRRLTLQSPCCPCRSEQFHCIAFRSMPCHCLALHCLTLPLLVGAMLLPMLRFSWLCHLHASRLTAPPLQHISTLCHCSCLLRDALPLLIEAAPLLHGSALFPYFSDPCSAAAMQCLRCSVRRFALANPGQPLPSLFCWLLCHCDSPQVPASPSRLCAIPFRCLVTKA